MKKNKIFNCEVLIWFLADGKREQRWVLRPVEEVGNHNEVRCKKCHEPVRIHRQRKSYGPKDHVEHFVVNENCPLCV